MFARLSLAAAALATTLLLPAPAGLVVHLSDGTQIAGTLEAWNAARGQLVLRTGLSSEPIALDLSKLVSISADADAARPPAGGDGASLIQLTNGDRLLGKLETFSLDQARLRTSWGEVAVTPSMIGTLRRDSNSRLLFDYRDGSQIDGWSLRDARPGENGIVLNQGGRLVAPLQLPSSYSLTLDFAQPLAELAFGLSLHVDPRGEADWQSPNYEFSLTQGQMLAFSSSGGNRNNRLRYPSTGQATPDGSCSVQLLVDRHTGQIGVSIDGGSVIVLSGLPEFPLPDGEAKGPDVALLANGMMMGELRIQSPAHSSLLLRSQQQEPLQLTGLRLESWAPPVGGMRATSAGPRHGTDPGKNQPTRLLLVNGDSLAGKLVGLDEHSFILDVGGIRVPVAAGRVEEVQSQVGQDLARRLEHDVRVELLHGEVLTLQVEGIVEGCLVGHSDNLAGSVAIPLEQCRRIESGLYDDLLPPLDRTASGIVTVDWDQVGQPTRNASSPIIGMPSEVNF